VHLPLAVHFDGKTVPAFTQDVSGRGIFFFTEAELPEGAVVELTFTMPSEITLGESMPVRCRGRVLRCGPAQGGRRNGVAVRLDSYEYLTADEQLFASQFVRAAAAAVGSGARPASR
jgi:hypothetical protein